MRATEAAFSGHFQTANIRYVTNNADGVSKRDYTTIRGVTAIVSGASFRSGLTWPMPSRSLIIPCKLVSFVFAPGLATFFRAACPIDSLAGKPKANFAWCHSGTAVVTADGH